MRDPYECLAVPPTATADDIGKSFRRLAKKLHPDANNDPNAAAQFAELTAAHEILGNEKRRLDFDSGEIDAEGKPRRPNTRHGVLLTTISVLLVAATSALLVRYLTPQREIEAIDGNQVGTLSELQLVAQQNNAFVADGAIPLGIRVSGEAVGLAVEIRGLPTGTTLSSGRPLGSDGWRILAADIGKAMIHPPPGSSGTIDVAVELRLADDNVIDRGSYRLKWTTAVAPVRTTADPVSRATKGAATPAPTGRNGRHDAAKPEVDHDQIELLVARSQQLVSEGDVGAARTLLQRAAEAGDARAALALGSTYDPIMLAILHARGVTADAFLARYWYRKASGFGSQEAQQRFDLLAPR